MVIKSRMYPKLNLFFSDGTVEVKYELKSSNAAIEVSNNPEEVNVPTYTLKDFKVSDADGAVPTDSATNRTSDFMALLETALNVSRADDVFIQNPKTVTIANLSVDAPILAGLSGKSLIVDNFPNIIFSGIQHNLPWYSTEINR